METISIKDENGKEYRFEKPEFECELLKVLGTYIIGYVYKDTVPLAVSWCTKRGHSFIGNDDGANNGKFDLTPIKPKWYEDESNFPAFVTQKGIAKIMVAKTYDDWWSLEMQGARLATKEELLSLYYQGKEK